MIRNRGLGKSYASNHQGFGSRMRRNILVDMLIHFPGSDHFFQNCIYLTSHTVLSLAHDPFHHQDNITC